MKYTRGFAALLLATSAVVLAGCGGSDDDSVGDDGRVPVVGTSTFVREDAVFNVFDEPGGEFAGPDAGQAGWIEPTDQT